MSVFNEDEIAYLGSQSLGRLATVSPDGRPHVTPVTFIYNPLEDAIDVGGVAFGSSKKWRDAQRNEKVTLLVDDVIPQPRRARALEIRGDAEVHATGGDAINPRFPNFTPEFIRIRPTRIVSWGLGEQDGATGDDLRASGRSVA